MHKFYEKSSSHLIILILFNLFNILIDIKLHIYWNTFFNYSEMRNALNFSFLKIINLHNLVNVRFNMFDIIKHFIYVTYLKILKK